MPRFILAAALLLPPLAGGAAPCSVASGLQQTALVELYTSEGCSSCPPAERWLNALAASPQAGAALVALAWHVDYWDALGWRDRYAQARFSARQREQAARRQTSFIYTPQVLLNGREYRAWHDRARWQRDFAASARQPATATIRLSATEVAGSLHLAAASRLEAPDRAELHLAVYEDGLRSSVHAGENRGATLEHERVMRAWLGPYAAGTAVTERLALPAAWNGARLGVAAFVQNRGDGRVLQAVSLRPCREEGPLTRLPSAHAWE